MSRIGFIGLGNMGEPMARRLLDAGHGVVGYDASPEARARLAGAGMTVAATAALAAAGAEIVILMLPDSTVVEQVALHDGVLAQVTTDALVVDMSSSEPIRTQALARRAAEMGVTLVDAPVSGGVVGARTGALTVMVGGPAEVCDRLRPVLSVLGTRVLHAGEVVGSGHAIKALNNLMSAAHLMVTAEAMQAGQAFGLDPAVMLDIVNGSSGRSGSTEQKWPRFVLPGTYDSGFALRLMVKDMGVALSLERATGTPAPLSEAALAAWDAAAADLPVDADHTEVAAWVRQRQTRRPV